MCRQSLLLHSAVACAGFTAACCTRGAAWKTAVAEAYSAVARCMMYANIKDMLNPTTAGERHCLGIQHAKTVAVADHQASNPVTGCLMYDQAGLAVCVQAALTSIGCVAAAAAVCLVTPPCNPPCCHCTAQLVHPSHLPRGSCTEVLMLYRPGHVHATATPSCQEPAGSAAKVVAWNVRQMHAGAVRLADDTTVSDDAVNSHMMP